MFHSCLECIMRQLGSKCVVVVVRQPVYSTCINSSLYFNPFITRVKVHIVQSLSFIHIIGQSLFVLLL